MEREYVTQSEYDLMNYRNELDSDTVYEIVDDPSSSKKWHMVLTERQKTFITEMLSDKVKEYDLLPNYLVQTRKSSLYQIERLQGILIDGRYNRGSDKIFLKGQRKEWMKLHKKDE